MWLIRSVAGQHDLRSGEEALLTELRQLAERRALRTLAVIQDLCDSLLAVNDIHGKHNHAFKPIAVHSVVLWWLCLLSLLLFVWILGDCMFCSKCQGKECIRKVCCLSLFSLGLLTPIEWCGTKWCVCTDGTGPLSASPAILCLAGLISAFISAKKNWP